MTSPEIKVLPHGEPMPEGYKPLVTLEMPDGSKTTSREAATSRRPVPDSEVERNIRMNMARGLPILRADVAPHDRTMVLACYGPSLQDTWEALLDMPANADLWTTSGAYSFLVDKGIVPDFHTDVDPREHKPWLLRDPQPHTTFYIPTRANPGFFTRLTGMKVVMYHLDVKEEKHIIWDVDENAGLVPPAISAGLCAIRLAIVLGYRKFVILGMDGSFRQIPGDRIPEMHAGAHPNGGEGFSVVEIEHPETHEKRQFVTNMLHLLAVDDYFVISRPYPVGTFQFIGDGLLPWVEQCARKG